MRPGRFLKNMSLGTVVAVYAVVPIPTLNAEGCRSIDQVPNVISAPGRYCLAHDLVLPADAPQPFAILITANDVVLDLKRHVLQGPGKGAGVTGMQLQNVAIRNGTIKGFNLGVSFGTMKPEPVPRRYVIEDLQIEDTGAIGVYLVGDDSVVRRNVVRGTGGGTYPLSTFPSGSATGIQVTGRNAKIIGNKIIGTHRNGDASTQGIFLTAGPNSEIRGNVVDSADTAHSVGILIPDDTELLVAENTVTGVVRGIAKHRFGPRQSREPTGEARLENNKIEESLAQFLPRPPPGGYRIQWAHGVWPIALAISPDGRLLAAGGREGILRVYETATRRLVHELEGHRGDVYAIAFGPHPRLVSGGADGTVRIWDVHSGRLLDTVNGHKGSVFGVAVSTPAGMLASTGADGKVRLWTLSNFSPIHTFDVNRAPERSSVTLRSVDFTPDGKLLLAGGQGGVMIWNMDSREEYCRLRVFAEKSESRPAHWTERFYSATTRFSNDGRLIVSAGSGGIRVELWETKGCRPWRSLTSGNHSVEFAAFAPSGQYLAASGSAGLLVWTLAKGDRPRTFMEKYYDRVMFESVFTPDSKTLVLAGSDRMPLIRFFDVTSGKELFPATAP